MTFTVLDLLDLDLKGQDALSLHCLSGRRGLANEITLPDLNRPGLALSGFFDSFAHRRVQLFGQGEFAYIEKLAAEAQESRFTALFSYEIPCCIFARGLTPPPAFTDAADAASCPILQTPIESTLFSSRLLRVLLNIFAPRQTVHGVFVEVFGVGVLIIGNSGIGKSETALELIERGHRLVTDDYVELRRVNGNTILGRGCNTMVSHHMEIRGLGIINVQQLYGVGAIREQKEVQLVVKLESWNTSKVYDRLGIEASVQNLLGVEIPLLEVPVQQGRNIALLIETAAKNERLKSMGVFSAIEFNKNVLKWIETDNPLAAYYSSDDSY